jgi:hypothetical protein
MLILNPLKSSKKNVDKESYGTENTVLKVEKVHNLYTFMLITFV